MQKKLKIAKEISLLMPRIARRILLSFFQTVAIPQTQLFTIMALDDLGPSRLTDLKKKLQIAAPTVTGIIDRLEKQGYVTRTPDTQDRRAIYIHLTPKGDQIAKKLRATLKKRWLEILVKLSQEDCENYLTILKKIQQNL